jgi:hypothetical protein
MEMGADALLINSAIALAGDPPAMARAMALACRGGPQRPQGRPVADAGRSAAPAPPPAARWAAEGAAGFHDSSVPRALAIPRALHRVGHHATCPADGRSRKKTAAGSTPLPRNPRCVLMEAGRAPRARTSKALRARAELPGACVLVAVGGRGSAESPVVACR